MMKYTTNCEHHTDIELKQKEHYSPLLVYSIIDLNQGTVFLKSSILYSVEKTIEELINGSSSLKELLPMKRNSSSLRDQFPRKKSSSPTDPTKLMKRFSSLYDLMPIT